MPLALAPAGESANSHALRPVANGRILVSQSLFEIGIRPSSRNVSRYFLWFVV